ncbi:MAG: hypothetical protein GXN92_03315 [Candidatus Micrarchaeota archaeon]|nr:hypothetical protein [Candidatus Micrarchaeota archaeon]
MDPLKYGDMFYQKYLLTMDPSQLEISKRYYEKALPHPMAKLRLYIIYKLLGEESKAQQMYDQLEVPQKKYVDAWFIYPENPAKAAIILEGEADFLEYYMLKAAVLMMLDRYQEVVEMLEGIKDRFPEVIPFLNTLKKFLESEDKRIEELLLDKMGNVIESRVYEVEKGEDLLKEIMAEETEKGYLIKLPKNPDLRELGLYFLTHTYTPVPREILQRLKWSG